MAKRQGLGKGLESLLGEATAESGIAAEEQVPISRVRPNKNQPRKRFDDDALAELADSIRQNGIIQPLVVRRVGANYEIVAGERRYRAAKLAKLKEVPVVVRNISDEDAYKIALIENLQRSDLNPIEEAQGYRQLAERDGLTQDELARLVSKSRSAVANTLRLLDLPDEVQELMREGRLTAGHARAILAVKTEEGRVRLAHKVVDESLSVRQTESMAPLFSVEQASPPKRAPQPKAYKDASRRLRAALGTDVRVRTVRGKNKIEIEFADEGDLGRIMAVITEGGGTHE